MRLAVTRRGKDGEEEDWIERLKKAQEKRRAEHFKVQGGQNNMYEDRTI